MQCMAVPSLVAERGFSGWWLWPAGHLAGERRPSSCLPREPSSTQPAKQHRLDVMPLGNCRLQEAANIMIACIFYEDMTWASLAGSSIRTSAQFLLFSQNNIGTVGSFEDFAFCAVLIKVPSVEWGGGSDGVLNKEGKVKSRQSAPVHLQNSQNCYFMKSTCGNLPSSAPFKYPWVSPHLSSAICVPQSVPGYKGG